MNNRNKLIIIVAVLAVIIIGLIIFVVGMKPNDQPAPTDGSTVPGTTVVTNPSEETTNPATQQTEETEATEPTETTVPTQETDPVNTETSATEPVETKPAETKPEETEPQETKPQETEPAQQGKNPWDVTYDTYQNMSAAEQKAQMESFGSIEEFFVWYNAAKKKYQDENPGIEIGAGDVVTPGGN